MGKVPLEEYFEHLQGLDVEGKIKYLLDKMSALDEWVENREIEFCSHVNGAHQEIIGSLEALTERCNIHQKEIDKLLSPAVAMLIKQMKAHMEAHQALTEAREAGKC